MQVQIRLPLQSHHFGIETEFLVMIVVPHLTCNRTILELKRLCKDWADFNHDPCNRTILELKQEYRPLHGQVHPPCNRTILELKRAIASNGYLEADACNRTILELKRNANPGVSFAIALAIAPFWN